MELTLARGNMEEKPQKISLEKLFEKLEAGGDKVFYFDRANNHKDLLKAVNFFEGKGRKAYLSEIKISLDEKDYIYELHII
ncbi:hypothetical protein BKH46_03190 [Helicobacter sp. 12S02634-8]|uniref:HP0268 family nuclease n=1 Tax=Helicobacter sp. 12S02634-8 TaxID=1476199 RepID=UPI000BA6991E|nr:HP0268 family nuclease [Helicobacter sp. 12S02634-8]PAF47848.1 hypothetical protein BKH46_03190 [Helicobacter sp. 12S02634-8]